MKTLLLSALAAGTTILSAQTDEQWFEKMEIGPAWMGTFGDYFHGEERVGALKGLSVDLGDSWRALYDTENLRLVTIYEGELEWGGTPWTGEHGGFTRLGNQNATMVTSAIPGWANEDGSFEDRREIKGYGNLPNGRLTGHYRHNQDVVIQYTINGADVMETLSRDGGVVTRSIQIKGAEKDLVLLLADTKEPFATLELPGPAVSADGLKVVSSDNAELMLAEGMPDRLLAKLPAGDALYQFAYSKADKAIELAAAPDFESLTSGSPAIWNEILTTEGKLAENEDDAYLTDLVTLPDENPWGANLRFGGFDFIDEDSAALSSWNGDVWVVRGLSGDWKELKWQRIAAGLFETLGLKVVDGKIYVNGRDQITELVDLNGDGETDYFKVFNRDVYITENFHEFAFDLQTDPEGNFYFSKAAPVRNGGRGFEKILPHHGIVAKISADGQKFEVAATGLRAPGGVGIGPNGEITTGENEGTWQPVCKINYVKAGDSPAFFGTEDSRQELIDAPYTEPLIYIPMKLDNSGGSQTWVPESAKFGIEPGTMLHASYGRSSIYKVLPVEWGEKTQGGIVKLPITLQSSAMRMSFHEDGSMYALGFRGWQTNAATKCAFQRIRRSEEVPLLLPTKLEYTESGVKVTFPVKLDEELANDPTSYSVQRWTYVRGPQYGSGEFSVDEPDQELMEEALKSESKRFKIRDDAKILSAKLSEDGMAVALEIEGMKPSMSLRVAYDLEDLEGEILNDEIHATVYKK